MNECKECKYVELGEKSNPCFSCYRGDKFVLNPEFERFVFTRNEIGKMLGIMTIDPLINRTPEENDLISKCISLYKHGGA